MAKRFFICCLIMFGIQLSGLAMDQSILNGAGATFPSPLYRKWIDVYRQYSNARIDYLETGSGKGVQLFLDRQLDFGATDVFLTEEELQRCPSEIIHIPTCLGAVVVVFNLPHLSNVRLTSDMLAAIFMGQITRWSDERLVRENPGLRQTDKDITVVHRSDSSGTTFLFSDYLSKAHQLWNNQMGRGNLLKWPVGIGLEGNPGVTEYVKKIPGSISYVSLNYAIENKLPVALVQNRSGNFILPSLQSVSSAGEVEIPKDMRLLITDTAAPDGYPISALTYLIVFKEQGYLNRSRETAESLFGFLQWITTKGQDYTESLNYARLPAFTAPSMEKALRSMTFKGDTIWNALKQ